MLHEVKRVTYYHSVRIHVLKEPRLELGDEIGKEVQVDVVESL